MWGRCVDSTPASGPAAEGGNQHSMGERDRRTIVRDYIAVIRSAPFGKAIHQSRFTTVVLLFAWENHIAAVSFRATCVTARILVHNSVRPGRLACSNSCREKPIPDVYSVGFEPPG